MYRNGLPFHLETENWALVRKQCLCRLLVNVLNILNVFFQDGNRNFAKIFQWWVKERCNLSCVLVTYELNTYTQLYMCTWIRISTVCPVYKLNSVPFLWFGLYMIIIIWQWLWFENIWIRAGFVCVHNMMSIIYICNTMYILSGNFSEADLGRPILDVVLDPGDLLYFPRGTIHQVKGNI